MQIAAIFLSAFCAAALGIPLGDHVQHEKRVTGHGLIKSAGAALDGDATVPVRIALKQRNREQGMKLLMEVSDPASAKYGQHYTAEQVADIFAPEDASVDKVTQWLKAAGIDGITVPKSKGYVDFQTTAKKLESLLQAKYHVYDHAASDSQHFGTDAYHLPGEISQVVDFVAPGIVTASMKKRDSAAVRPGRPARLEPIPEGKAAAGCDRLITPKCIKQMYNVTDGTLHDPSNVMGLFEADDEVHRQSDLDIFYSKYATNIPKGTGPKIDLIDWNGQKPDPNGAVGEAALDFDMAIPLIYPQGTELYQTKTQFDGNTHVGIFNQWLDAIDGSYCTSSSHGETGDDPTIDGTTKNEMCGKFKPANVISVSYGLAEVTWPANYLERQCDEFMKLGLQGVSIVVASGDGGVAGGHGGDCLGDNSEIFNPPGPGSCPAVTAVGSTYLPPGASVGSPEHSTTSFSSGGGFSNVFAQPDYQQKAVSDYFSNSDPGFDSYKTKDGKIPSTGGIYNKAGRGFPDVAAVGDNGAVVLNGQASLSGGTSMSAPVFAAILTRINEERIHGGKKPIGFANPAMYKNPSMFHDITIGEQSDANGSGACGGKGFKAVKGWDPVSGLGTPNYPAMLEYFKNL